MSLVKKALNYDLDERNIMQLYNNQPKEYGLRQCYNCRYHIRYHNEKNRNKRHKCIYIHEYFDPLKVSSCDNFRLGESKNYHRKSKIVNNKTSKKNKIKQRNEVKKRKEFEARFDDILQKMSNKQ